ncbi:hypothetical protein [Pyruvatibacter sp.]|uniref:hypothetical protein n=1 Tax=Pyruvatibacter sp. TaxID=1981328 RepID=UPI0032650F26
MTPTKISALALICTLGLALSACAGDRSERIAAQNEIDHQNCLELGFEEGTEAYGNCRLKLREIRAAESQRDSGGNFGVGIGIGIGL